jgi:small subunit ribosomal protein S20
MGMLAASLRGGKMPHHKSAEKRVRTTERQRQRNLSAKRELRSVTRKLHEGARSEGAETLLREVHSTLDNLARRGIIHSKTADRRKSRLAKLVAKNRPAAGS